MSKYSCEICALTFSTLSNFKRHNKRKHKDLIVIKLDPAQDLTTERHTFYSDEDFREWKRRLEMESGSSFVRRSGVKHRNEHTTVQYYQCHRSGTYTPLQLNRKRNLKSSGSIKIGANCPAKIVKLRTHIDCAVEIAVRYVATHQGHCQEPASQVSTKTRPTKTAGTKSIKIPSPQPPPQSPPSEVSQEPPAVLDDSLSNSCSPVCDAHTLSGDLPLDGIIETQPGLSWIFASNTGSESSSCPKLETCEVDRVRESCQQPRCQAWCEPCQACLHPYQCTCAEYSIRLLVCKHVHRVAQINQLPITHEQHANNEVPVIDVGGASYQRLEMTTSVDQTTLNGGEVGKQPVLSLEQAVDEALRTELGTIVVKIPDAALEARRADLVGRLHAVVDKTRFVISHQQMDVLDSLVANMMETMDNYQLHFFSQAGVAIPMFMCSSSGQLAVTGD